MMIKTYAEIELLWVQNIKQKPLLNVLHINEKTQQLIVYRDAKAHKQYPISTAKNGLGNQEGSHQTPTGFHQISEKIGDLQPINSLFNARQATGELAIVNDKRYCEQDTITSRILWLSGLEKGVNLEGDVDTKQRYIYIHGTADEAHLGQAVSHGCIRMKNTHIIELFNQVEISTVVYID